MKKKLVPQLSISGIQRLTIKALFSDDYLVNKIVLKGGNALAHAHSIEARSSIDIDISIRGDFDQPLNEIEARLTKQVERVFDEVGCVVFDTSFYRKPEIFSKKGLSSFWGGYLYEFKVISRDDYKKFGEDLNQIRRRGLDIDVLSRKTFTVEFSRFEYCEPVEEKEIDGSIVTVYSPLLIVIEKLRAICQQLPDYQDIIPSMKGRPRPRDFFDVFHLVEEKNLQQLIGSTQTAEILQAVFHAKRVPLEFLHKIEDSRDFHEAGFESVTATVAPGNKLEPFGFYFDYVMRLITKITANI